MTGMKTRRTTDVQVESIRDVNLFDETVKKNASEVLMTHASDDNGMIVGTTSTVANVEGLLKIQVARREAGPWCFSAMAVSNGEVLTAAWKGSYPSRAEAAIAAGMAIDEFLPMPQSLKNKTQRENLNAVLDELEKLDKWMRSELKESKRVP